MPLPAEPDELDEQGEPAAVTASQHSGAERCAWSEIETGERWTTRRLRRLRA